LDRSALGEARGHPPQNQQLQLLLAQVEDLVSKTNTEATQQHTIGMELD
jgi:hypothetical protein